MGKIVLAVVVGVAVGLVIASFIGWAAGYMFPPSVLVDMDPEKAKTMPMPMGEIFIELLGWLLGALAGGLLAARTAATGDWPAWATAAVMAISVVLFAMVWPHPIWFVIMSVLVVAAAGFGAGRLGGQVEENA